MIRVFDDIGMQVWYQKYRYDNEQTIQDTFHRVAKAIADDENEYQEFMSILGKFIPGGRILSNAGTSRKKVILFNCAVITIEDSIEGIMQAVTEYVHIIRQGGGVGLSLDPLRPKGAWVKGIEGESSGPISFAKIFNTASESVSSAGMRRAALILILNYQHPDILQFVKVKSDLKELTKANLSVGIDKYFLQQAEKDGNIYLYHWIETKEESDRIIPNDAIPYISLQQTEISDGLRFKWRDKYYKVKIYKTVKAKELYNTIIEHMYNFAEPGLLFLDTINKSNNLYPFEHIYTTNPCGEQCLPVNTQSRYGLCNLGSMVLPRYVIQDGNNFKFDFEQFSKDVKIAVKFLTNVIYKSNYVLKGQKEEAYNKRRIGLGFTGLANVFILLGARYGDKKSQQITKQIARELMRNSYLGSIDLVEKYGTAPFIKEIGIDNYLNNCILNRTEDNKDIIDKIRKHGICNTHLNTCAPTGSLSLIAGNVSSGIEPVFLKEYIRNVVCDKEYKYKVAFDDGSVWLMTEEEYKTNKKPIVSIEEVQLKKQPDNTIMFPVITKDYILNNYPDYKFDNYVTIKDLSVKDHLIIMSIAQKYIDSSISKTINLPKDSTIDEIKEVIQMSYDMGLKGCTLYREGSRSAVLEEVTSDSKINTEEVQKLKKEIDNLKLQLEQCSKGKKIRCPIKMHANTWHIDFGSYKGLITIGEVNRKPREVIINMGKSGTQEQALCEALGRAISKLLQYNIDIVEVCKCLTGIRDGSNIWHKINDRQKKPVFINSLPDAIGKILLYTYEYKEEMDGGDKCPKCLLNSVYNNGGCRICINCGFSRCE